MLISIQVTLVIHEVARIYIHILYNNTSYIYIINNITIYYF